MASFITVTKINIVVHEGTCQEMLNCYMFCRLLEER